MKVLVATSETRGQRKNDFGHATDGEIVMFGSECDGEPVDGRCGCRRAMIGVDSHKATTTMKVVDMPTLTQDGLTERVHAALKAGGWGRDDEAGLRKWAQEDAKELARVAAFFTVGFVVEKRGGKFQVRRPMK